MIWFYRLLFKVFLLSVYFQLPAMAQDMKLVVIANDKGAPTEMKSGQLTSVMKGEKLRWPDGTKVSIALMKSNTTIGVNTSKKIYNMSANELNKYWLALVFQGKANAPNFFNSEAELEDFISQTKAAIGVVSQPATSTKTVVIDGKTFL